MTNTISGIQAASAEYYGFGRLVRRHAKVTFFNHSGNVQALWFFNTAKKAKEEIEYFRRIIKEQRTA